MDGELSNCISQDEWLDSDRDTKSNAGETTLNESQLRDKVFHRIEHLIEKRTVQLCKEFCYQHRYEYYCTVDGKWGVSCEQSALCEWGNATYAWMLDDLLKSNRVKPFAGKSSESTVKYFSKIIHSQIFKERFKDWRFGRRIRVPEYIKVLDKDAQKIFWRLCDHDEPENIAQQLGRPFHDVAQVVERIHRELHRRNKIHLLLGTTNVAMDELDEGETLNIAGTGRCAASQYEQWYEEERAKETVMNAYRKLSWKEQYVLDAMVVDGLKAGHVLQALRSIGISLTDDVPPSELTEQKVYYFLRKTMVKLKKLTGI